MIRELQIDQNKSLNWKVNKNIIADSIIDIKRDINKIVRLNKN